MLALARPWRDTQEIEFEIITFIFAKFETCEWRKRNFMSFECHKASCKVTEEHLHIFRSLFFTLPRTIPQTRITFLCDCIISSTVNYDNDDVRGRKNNFQHFRWDSSETACVGKINFSKVSRWFSKLRFMLMSALIMAMLKLLFSDLIYFNDH